MEHVHYSFKYNVHVEESTTLLREHVPQYFCPGMALAHTSILGFVVYVYVCFMLLVVLLLFGWLTVLLVRSLHINCIHFGNLCNNNQLIGSGFDKTCGSCTSYSKA